MALFRRKARKRKKTEENVNIGRVSQIPMESRDIYVTLSRTRDILAKIACEQNPFKAIETIIDETPDGKQAYNIYLRLANQGVKIELYNKTTNKLTTRYDKECRRFCAELGVNNSEGLDGFIDQLHGSSIARGGMACEVVVNEDGNEIEDVFLVDPASFMEYKWSDEKHRYEIYQFRDDGKKIDLYDGNFFYVPHQPKAGRPEGTLQFLAAIPTVTQFYQLLSDSLRIMNRIGYPRYKITIDREGVLNSVPASQKATFEQQQKIFKAVFNDVEANMRAIGQDSDIITFDSNQIETIGGSVNGSGIDVRAWFEVLEPLIVNSFTMTPVLLGRLNAGSYSLGTVEFKIVTDTVDSMRRGSKRIIEDVINLWARVNGYPVYCVATHNPINWEVQKEKIESELLNVEKFRRAEEYGWIDHSTAAMDGIGAEKAFSEFSNGLFEYLSHDLRQENTDSQIENDE